MQVIVNQSVSDFVTPNFKGFLEGINNSTQ